MTEIIDKLPTTWNHLTLEKYQQIIQHFGTMEFTEEVDDIFAGADNTIGVLHVLTGMSIEDIENLPLSTIHKMSAKLNFMLTPPDIDQKKSLLKWKALEAITFNDYLTFTNLSKEPIPNMHLIIQAFSKLELEADEVLQMGMYDVMNGFFLLQKDVKQSLKNSIKLTKKKLKQQIKAEKKNPQPTAAIMQP